MSVRLAEGSAIEGNHDCLVLDDTLLDTALRASGTGIVADDLARDAPHLFSRASVFIDRATAEAMRQVVAAVERVVALADYRVLAGLTPHIVPRQRGAFLGFDFHLSAEGPQLIEINTNAGGGVLNALLRRSQRSCCSDIWPQLMPEGPEATQAFIAMLRAEWQLARGHESAPAVVAIVDDDPPAQYLYPEFRLFRSALEAVGLRTLIVDAGALSVHDDRLWGSDVALDLVYNRSTDFALEEPRHQALAEAYARDLAVITPHPAAHALYADKRRLCTLSDAAALAQLDVNSEDSALLVRHIPRTVEVEPSARDALWAARRTLFFKPCAGYGSKAAYRGDKLTRRVFEEQILVAPYVAQRLVPPSSRVVHVSPSEPRALKVDVRNFAYAGHVQLVCARLYDGQTTNFRTRGGGFAPVFETRA